MQAIGRVVTTSDAAQRSIETFDDRFAAVRPRLLSICRGLVGPALAEDLVHDTYLRGRGKIHQLRDPGLFDAWIARIAINLCFNSHRRSRRLQAREIDAATAPRVPERDLALVELIEQLAPRERTVIVLHYGHGYPVADIARFVGVSDVNARTILFRARMRLGDRLREAEQ
jgi:RNA polymerase sigma factor (sigma-70 family)